jgi:hypothetical protein
MPDSSTPAASTTITNLFVQLTGTGRFSRAPKVCRFVKDMGADPPPKFETLTVDAGERVEKHRADSKTIRTSLNL